MLDDKSHIIKSIGIDIGTTTTQLVLSDLIVKNISSGTLVPKIEITKKNVVYKSKIYFTPIKNNLLVDDEKVAHIIKREYLKAGITSEDIDTGAVIITGETAKKENAKKISLKISSFAGNFVVATAGGNLESIIAAKGSGAAEYSRQNYSTTANIDIGGGTSNIAVFKDGKVIDCCCLNVGGRIIEIERESKKINHIAEPMKMILDALNINIDVGDSVDICILKKIVNKMADILMECLFEKKLSALTKSLLMSDQLCQDYTVDCIMVSGGVANCLHDYRNEDSGELQKILRYGDIGPLFGQEVMKKLSLKNIKLQKPSETIRATVIGAGIQIISISGSTIYVNNNILPLKNIPVIKPFNFGIPEDINGISSIIRKNLERFFNVDYMDNIAIAVPEGRYLSFSDINILARGIVNALDGIIKPGKPIIVIMEQDYAKVLGQSLRMLVPNTDIICIDQIQVSEGDYVDIGKIIPSGEVVPVAIKTLVFQR
jgi:ethanolamine utilization protein EutA